MSVFTLKVNGQSHTVDVDPTTPLLYVLSDDLALKGPKFGCGLGQCGSCTAIVNGRAVRSCRTPVSTVSGAAIVTLEGLGTPEKPHPIQKAFIDAQAAQDRKSTRLNSSHRCISYAVFCLKKKK